MEQFKPYEKEYSEILSIGYIGALTRLKGIDILLKSVSELTEEWTLTIVGDGPDKDYLKVLAEKLNIESNIFWLGRKNHSEIPDIININPRIPKR